MPADKDERRERNAIRRQMRDRRRAMPPTARRAADQALCRHVGALPAFRAARRIGVYLAFDGEPDLSRLADAAARSGKRIFVPVIDGRDIFFTALSPRSRWVRNRYGILEPRPAPRVDARALDLVLTPLVAFDARGGRLGVGRGYYDRRFAFLRNRRSWLRPKLLGIGYSFQEIAPRDWLAWDVPLWSIATERGVRRFAVRASE